MKEVSCRVFDIFFQPIEEKQLSPALMVEGTALPLATLRNKDERVDWSDFAIIMGNLRKVFTDDEYVEMGRSYFRSPMLRFAAVVASLLFSAKDFYRWLTSPKSGAGNQMFRCIDNSFRELASGKVEIALEVQEPHVVVWDFFVITQGNLMEMPRLLGLPAATVELTALPRGARYLITFVERKAVIPRIRQALLMPFNFRAAGRELMEAHETLQDRYDELEAARVTLARQAAQLRTAHRVNALIYGNLDLDRTVDTVASALVEEASFAGADVSLEAKVDGVAIVRASKSGVTDGVSPLARELVGRGGQKLGELRAWPASSSDRAEREEFLSFIVPTVSMALENAISYQVLAEYRRGLEFRVAERTTDLTQARDKLAATVTELEAASQVRDRIFANVNHEIRTPLSLILLAVAEARAQQNSAGAHEASRSLDAIERGARRLLRMVDELLLLAERREAEVTLTLAPHDLKALVETAVRAWEPAARAAGLSLALVANGPCTARIDVAAAERILMNLLSNAVKFTPAGGRIDVTLEQDATHGCISVRDTGIGIDDDLKKSLFGRFERGRSPGPSSFSGSGLGLSIVKELTTEQAGTIEVESPASGGTIFRVRLPLATGERSLAPGAPRLRPADFGFTPVMDGLEQSVFEPTRSPVATVLLAEDDPELRGSIVRLLLSARYRVVVAADGKTALELAEIHRPDLLVTDINMPNMGGIELTRRFCALAGLRFAPVLVLTAFAGVRDRLAGFDAGAVDYIMKPFEPEELLARVGAQLAMRTLTLQLFESEKLAALGTLSAGLAHEMRNPANGIVNAIQPLRELLPPELLRAGEPIAELVGVIQLCSQQVADLSKQLLGFRRGAPIDQRRVALDSVLERVHATSTAVLIDVELREQLEYRGPVMCSETLLTQALGNLLDNAAASAGPGGWVNIRTELEAEHVVVEFSDSGPGVPHALSERIFEPFFTTKPPGQGTGLGLSTAREILLRHGGRLDLRTVGGRSIFRVEMPAPPTEAGIVPRVCIPRSS